VRLGYEAGLSSFVTDRDVQEQFRLAVADVALPGEDAWLRMQRVHNESITASDGSGCTTSSSIDIDVYIKPRPQPPLPHYTMNNASAAPVGALMATSEAQADLNSNLTARGLPEICSFLIGPDVVTLGTNKDIWDAGSLGLPQGWYPEELNKSACFP